MSIAKVQQIGLTLVVGAFIGRGIGNLFFGFAASAILLTLVSIFLWGRRHQHEIEQRQAQELILYRALAERAVREGNVGSCPGCKRAMASQTQRCVYCGTYRGDGPLR